MCSSATVMLLILLVKLLQCSNTFCFKMKFIRIHLRKCQCNTYLRVFHLGHGFNILHLKNDRQLWCCKGQHELYHFDDVTKLFDIRLADQSPLTLIFLGRLSHKLLGSGNNKTFDDYCILLLDFFWSVNLTNKK